MSGTGVQPSVTDAVRLCLSGCGWCELTPAGCLASCRTVVEEAHCAGTARRCRWHLLTSSEPVDAQIPELRVDARRNQRKILRAAARLLADDPSARIQQIADEAEVARLTVYRRYPTRKALLDAILVEAVTDGARRAGATSESDAADAIGRLVHSVAEIGANYPILRREPGASHCDDSPTAHGDMAAVVSEFDALVARGQADGTIRSDLSADVLRHSLLGMLAMSLRLTRRTGSRLTTAVVAEQVASLLVDGARPR